MALVLFLLILLQVINQPLVQTQAETSANPGVEVLRFSWNEFRRPALDSSNDEFPTLPKRQERVFTDETINQNTIENRSRDMRNAEERTSPPNKEKPGLEYRYSTRLRNKSDKIIRLVFWDYQSGEEADPDKLEHRQFRCAVKIKPAEEKSIDAYSRAPASRLVIASTGKRPPERVVINRLEFVDGTFWQRANWSAPEAVIKATGGGCRGF